MITKLMAAWKTIQAFADASGDFWLALFTTTIIMRILMVLSGHMPLTNAESMAYASAIGAFAYSNKGGKPS